LRERTMMYKRRSRDPPIRGEESGKHCSKFDKKVAMIALLERMWGMCLK